MKLFYLILLLNCFTAYGQNNPFVIPKYSIPADDFISQFNDTSNLSRIYCFNKKGNKVWLTNIPNGLLTLKLKDNKSKELELASVRYKNGIVDGAEIWRPPGKISYTKRPVTINFSDVFSIILESTYAAESPYFDFDSCKRIWKLKTDSIAAYYSTGKEIVLWLISKKPARLDSLAIYENACYNVIFKDNVSVTSGVVHKITIDSIYISNSFNSNSARASNKEYKILKYAVKDIHKLRLLKSHGYSYKDILTNEYNISPVEIERSTSVPQCWVRIIPYSGHVITYRAFLAESGFLAIGEEKGRLIWYER